MSGTPTPGKQIDMTEGVIWKQMLLFAIPLLVGEILQQMYNTVDSIIVGNFVSKQALAAVGATNNIVTVLIGFFTGLSTGATVVVAQYYGAHQEAELKNTVHTMILFTLLMGLAFTVIGVAGTPMMLRLLGTPEDVFPDAKIYLQIYFAGVSALVLYNMCAGILRAVGDSRSPLYILLLTTTLNIVLDLVFILVFRMGVAGAALATIIAQFISSLILLFNLCRTKNIYRLELRHLHIDKAILRRVIDIGLPAGLQKSITSFSNTIVLSYINKFGSGAMAGWSVHQRLDQIINRTTQSMSIATATFVGQNVGAGKEERIHKGIRTALRLSLLITGIYAVFFVSFNGSLIKLFNHDGDVLYYGKIIISVLAPLYLINTVNHIQVGALRGQGDSKNPMFILLFCHVILRQLYLNLGWSHFQSIYFVLSCYPVSWLLCCIIISAYAKMKRKTGTNPKIFHDGGVQ
ncbi:MATE family efflux transporter [Candidatus Formimonas warabiya]|uniref:MATE family efflux transporter n=1 Tax=Formimonas warabiya TaxID=1761012 RepID=A0A3G1KTS6_FORW1|nr:MATE family efflux transporter [Candidatus Formimonas warabiya]ATW25868.1 hypothetical protein DCMF_14795 [Candidatus Formimonas warabiya]